jgi:hypothetical protein
MCFFCVAHTCWSTPNRARPLQQHQYPSLCKLSTSALFSLSPFHSGIAAYPPRSRTATTTRKLEEAHRSSATLRPSNRILPGTLASHPQPEQKENPQKYSKAGVRSLPLDARKTRCTPVTGALLGLGTERRHRRRADFPGFNPR